MNTKQLFILKHSVSGIRNRRPEQNQPGKVNKLLLCSLPFNFRSSSVLLSRISNDGSAIQLQWVRFFICADVSHRVPRVADM